jgi:circadian clock protein KaiC
LSNIDLIAKLEESLQNDLGDWGRTQYLIRRIQKKQEIFQSDKKYLDKMLESMQLKTQKINLEPKKIVLQNQQSSFIDSLIKCNHCDTVIELNQKTIRKNNFWFHEKCFEKIDYKKETKTTQEIEVRQSTKSVNYYKPQKNIITSKTNLPQIIFTFSLLISLVTSIYLLFGLMFAIMTGILGVGNFIILYNSDITKLFNKKMKHTKTSESSLIKIGIPGFESLISNGLKKNSSILISGPPGSGKTTLGLQFLYSGARDFDEPGVYIAMSQNIDDIKNDCKSFGWDFDDLISKDKILMIDARPFKIQDELIGRDDSLYRGEQMPFEHLTKLLLSSIKRVEAKRLVIDSVTILAMQYSDKFYMRQGLQGMIQALENYGVTSLIISEYSENNEIPLEWFVTSGIIQMRHTRKEDTMERTIQVTKMRGIKHSQQIHPIIIDGDGVHIQHPRLTP